MIITRSHAIILAQHHKLIELASSGHLTASCGRRSDLDICALKDDFPRLEATDAQVLCFNRRSSFR